MSQDYSEFEIQAEAYANLKMFFHEVRGEYRFDCGYKGREHTRHDIVVFGEDGTLEAVIEVKKRAKRSKDEKHQLEKYANSFQCPVIMIIGMRESKAAVAIVQGALEDFAGNIHNPNTVYRS